MKTMKIMVAVVFAYFANCAFAATATVDGITWHYEVKNRTAKLGSMTIRYNNSGSYELWEPALETDTHGDISIPEMLSGYHKQDEIYELLIDRFNRHEEQRAMYASFLSKYGDERALPVLYKAIESVDLNYLDFIEIANAIESLGGERPADREFSGDPYYESLKGL